MMPMGLNSTQFVSYHEIRVANVDLIEDAWGLNTRFSDVINLIRSVNDVPEDALTKKLIERIRNHH
jgi:hypothetical protein